jgi:hypothetical protein
MMAPARNHLNEPQTPAEPTRGNGTIQAWLPLGARLCRRIQNRRSWGALKRPAWRKAARHQAGIPAPGE